MCIFLLVSFFVGIIFFSLSRILVSHLYTTCIDECVVFSVHCLRIYIYIYVEEYRLKFTNLYEHLYSRAHSSSISIFSLDLSSISQSVLSDVILDYKRQYSNISMLYIYYSQSLIIVSESRNWRRKIRTRKRIGFINYNIFNIVSFIHIYAFMYIFKLHVFDDCKSLYIYIYY